MKKLIQIAAVCGLCGCASTARLDRDVYREVERKAAAEPTVTTNAAFAANDVIETPQAGITNEVVRLDRGTALRLAARFSRDLQDMRDKLYADALQLFAARRQFEVQYSGTADYVFNKDRNDEWSRTGSAGVGASWVLPTGATITFAGDGSAKDTGGSNGVTYATSAGVRLDQPLGAGSGYEASHAPLIQAERDFTYELRSFSLERQDFAIGIVRDFFDLVQQKSAVSNQLLSLEQFAYLRKRSEALFSVRRAPAIDVLRAQQQELQATNQLTSVTETYQIQKARFMVQLGLPAAQAFTVVEDIPSLHEVGLDPVAAVALALERRPDVRTVRDRVDDAERSLRVARKAYQPEIGLFGKADVAGEGRDAGSQDFENTAAAGLAAELPFDRRGRRDAVRLAAIRLDEAKRSWQQKQDEVSVEVASSFSQLRALAKSVEIQIKNREIAERRAENANFRFKEGELSNRDVVEAQNDLLDARNAYVTALLDYEVQRLRLLRNVGLLDVASDGGLIELKP